MPTRFVFWDEDFLIFLAASKLRGRFDGGTAGESASRSVGASVATRVAKLPRSAILAIAGVLMIVGQRPAYGQAEPTRVLQLRFGTEESAKLTPVGGVERDVAGPRPPEFPDFDSANSAVSFNGQGARLVIDDPGAGSQYDFAQGDAITLEAWIKVDQSLGNDKNAYIIGKGRTGAAPFAADNQNW